MLNTTPVKHAYKVHAVQSSLYLQHIPPSGQLSCDVCVGLGDNNVQLCSTVAFYLCFTYLRWNELPYKDKQGVESKKKKKKVFYS